jgi:hypothetical protein
MYKLKLTGRNLGRVFKFRRDCFHAIQLYYFETKLTNFKLETRPKQLLGSPPVDIALPDLIQLQKKLEKVYHLYNKGEHSKYFYVCNLKSAFVSFFV